jgi:hypothetical protein
MTLRNSQIPDLPGLSISREDTRKRIAIISIGVFFAIIVLIVFGGWILLNANIDDIIKLLTAVSGVLSGIVGAIIGFYFRSEE